jgi:hypothetical protein
MLRTRPGFKMTTKKPNTCNFEPRIVQPIAYIESVLSRLSLCLCLWKTRLLHNRYPGYIVLRIFIKIWRENLCNVMWNEIIINLIQCIYLVLDTVTDDRTVQGISNVKLRKFKFGQYRKKKLIDIVHKSLCTRMILPWSIIILKTDSLDCELCAEA